MVVVKDPVCGMVFVREDAAGKTVYKDEEYYFCAPSCKKSFEAEPEKYLKKFNSSHSFSKEIYSEGDSTNEKDNSIRKHY